MSSQEVVECITSTYMTKNAHVERHRSMDFHVAISAACHHRCVDFRLFVQGYYTTQLYYDTWENLFHPIFNEDEWPLYDGPTIVPLESMKCIGSGRPKSTRLHNEIDFLNQLGCIMKWMLGRGKLLSRVGCANNLVTIGGLVRIEIKFNDRCEVTHFFFWGGGGGGGGGGGAQLPWGIVVALYNTYVQICISWIMKYLCTLFK